MVDRIPKKRENQEDKVKLIGIEKEEEEEKEKESLDPKSLKLKAEIEKVKGKLTIHISILFGYKLIVLPVYLLLTLKTFIISDVDILNRFKKVNLILDMDISIFFMLEMLIISILHFINLVILHTFFQKVIENRAKIDKFGKKAIVKKFITFLEKNDLFKFFIYILNIFLPLLIMVYIFYKSGKLHNSFFNFIHTVIIAINTVSIVWFLFRNAEIFNFGRKLDILIWTFMYIIFSIYLLHAYFIYFSLNFDINNKILYTSFPILFLILILMLILMDFLLSKYPEFLNLGAILLPTVVLFFSILVSVINFIFVVLDNKPKNMNVLNYLIPNLEIYSDEFNKIYQENGIKLKKEFSNDKKVIYISYKDISKRDKLNFIISSFKENFLQDNTIKFNEKFPESINKILELLYFYGNNLKFDKFINIYAELSRFNKVKLDFSHLEYSIFNYSIFFNSSIKYAYLKSIDLRYSIIKNVDFSNSNLANSKFSYSILINPKFSGANLKNADFSYSVLINPVFIENSTDKTLLESSNWENAILIFPKFCKRNKISNICVNFKETRNSESALIILNPTEFEKHYLSRFNYLNRLSDWYKKLKRRLKEDGNMEDKLLTLYFLYVLKTLQDNPETQYLFDRPYKITINRSTKLIDKDFKNFLKKKGLLKKQTEVLLSEFWKIKSFSLNEKQKNGIIVLLTIILMSSLACFFCKKAK